MQPEPPEERGEPYTDDTVEEPCYNCGVVQEMTIMKQEYTNHPDTHYPKGECPVCGNDHTENPPW